MSETDYGPKPPEMTLERFEQIKKWREVNCRTYNTNEYMDFMEFHGVTLEELRSMMPTHI